MKNIYLKFGVCLLAAISLMACKKENELTFSPNDSTVYVNVGEKTTLSVNSYGVKSSTPYPVSNVEWSVDDTYYASVDNNGVLTGLKDGATRACGKFDGGKVVYIDVVVSSLNIQYLEPLLKGTFNSVADYEATMSNRVLTRGVDSKFAVYKNTSDIFADKYQIYFFNQFNGGVISCLENGDAVEVARTKFLPDRYNVIGDNSFADNKNNKVETRADEFGYGMFYNFGDFNNRMSEVYAQYAADAVSYIDSITKQSNFTPEKLKLKLPFVITADLSKIILYKQNALNAISAGTNFGSTEAAISLNSELILDLYLQSARKWGLEEWCWKLNKEPEEAGLRKGHVQSEYTDIAWFRVEELDELAIAAFGEQTEFGNLEAVVRMYGKLYMDVASKSNISSHVKSINAIYDKAKSKFSPSASKPQYTQECWDVVSAKRDAAEYALNSTMYSYTEMQNFVQDVKLGTTKEASLTIELFSGEMPYNETGSVSYYKDVPTKTKTQSMFKDFENYFKPLYKESDYTAANWKRITSKYDETAEFIKKSTSIDATNNAVSEAKVYLSNIPKK